MSTESLEESLTYKEYDSSLNTHNRVNSNVIKNSKKNDEVMKLVSKNYSYLSDKCIRSDSDNDIFNDTVLYITTKYDPETDFNIQFIRIFNNLRRTKTMSKKLVDINIYSLDNLEYAAEFPYEEF